MHRFNYRLWDMSAGKKVATFALESRNPDGPPKTAIRQMAKKYAPNTRGNYRVDRIDGLGFGRATGIALVCQYTRNYI